MFGLRLPGPLIYYSSDVHFNCMFLLPLLTPQSPIVVMVKFGMKEHGLESHDQISVFMSLCAVPGL